MTKNGVRGGTNFTNEFNVIWVVQTFAQK